MQSKPGRFGTLHRYSVNYRSDTDHESLMIEKWQCWAYSKEHAIDKFNDGVSEQGWIALSVDSVK